MPPPGEAKGFPAEVEGAEGGGGHVVCVVG